MTKKSNFTPVVSSGSTVVGETVDGTQIINGGTAIGTTIIGGGVQNVLSGSLVSATVIINGGIQAVSGGAVSATTISSGGTQLVSGGKVSVATVSNGGSQHVNSGCAVTAITVGSAGVLEIVAGGTATGVTLNSGYYLHADTSATLAAGSVTINGGTAANIIMTGDDNEQSTLSVLAGGTAIDTTLNSNGLLEVYSGGTAISTIAYFGGLVLVESGGTATGAEVHGGACLFPQPGARIIGAIMSGGGTIDLTPGGIGSYVIDSLTVIGGGGVGLEDCDTTVGHNLTINSLTGSAEFFVNTDLANGKADTITIKNATSSPANRLQVNNDPVYSTGQSATGSASLVTVAKGTAVITPEATQGYTPTIVMAKPGVTTWTLTKLAPSSGGETGDSARRGIGGGRKGKDKIKWIHHDCQ
ncbi:MAG: pertactin-like passenger domain-containing protein [Negativicutes bacterium]|nr:pertactin-like passenger domain-containing protein [Negativicutes bacterium]